MKKTRKIGLKLISGFYDSTKGVHSGGDPGICATAEDRWGREYEIYWGRENTGYTREGFYEDENILKDYFVFDNDNYDEEEDDPIDKNEYYYKNIFEVTPLNEYGNELKYDEDDPRCDRETHDDYFIRDAKKKNKRKLNK